jgi:hypothetical protein
MLESIGGILLFCALVVGLASRRGRFPASV